MPEPVRVKDDTTGHEYSTYAVDEDGNTYEGLTVLTGEPAVDERGALLPPTYPEAEATAAAPAPAPRPTEPTPRAARAATPEEH